MPRFFFSFFLSFRRGIRPKKEEEGGDWNLGECTCIYVTFCKICKVACVRSGKGGGWCN